MRRVALCAVLAAGWGCVTNVTTPAAYFDEPAPPGALPVTVDREGPSREERERNASTHAFVAWFGVSAPMGRLVLMRRGSDLCAIRFTGFHRDDDANSGPFYVPGPNLYAEYDWYHLSASSARSGHRKLSQTGGLGIPFFFPLGTGTRNVECGRFRPSWSYPTAVRFLETREVADVGIELAPTGWRDTAEIDLAHPGLRWYRVNEKRKPFLIPLEQLPQAKGR